MDKVRTLYAYKLTSAGAKAANTYATAKCCGTRGNDLKGRDRRERRRTGEV